MITRYLPTFNQIEPDNLYGLTMGHVVAQVPVKYTAPVPAQGETAAQPESYGVVTKAVGDVKFIENGILCTFDANGKVVNWAANKPLFIHFTEELNTFLGDRKYFAVEANTDETYLRLVAVVPGSEWTTNIENDTAAKAIYTAAATAGKIVCINQNATLPDGRAAKTYRCIA